ncbi:MAG: GNAT family N-acetyltransferase [Defluviitaleaceae bacterium]|nr:GNAT family N-acetyltransferase [Defluviitaleaceae bacterium]
MITAITHQNMKDINKPHQPFNVIGKIIPEFIDGAWSYTECLLDAPYEKNYPASELNCEDFINNPHQIIYFYYDENECVGQIEITKNWNGYALIQNIAVAKNSRKKGVGAQLMNAAIEWAKASGLSGLTLETQDINVSACRFYNKIGFRIGGVDTMLYANLDTAHEKAIFWYMKF